MKMKNSAGDLEEKLRNLSDRHAAGKLLLTDFLNERQLMDNEINSEDDWSRYCDEAEAAALMLEKEIEKTDTMQGRSSANASSEKKASLFISYNAEDILYVHKMANYLKDKNIGFFVDYDAMMPGEDIKSRVEREIKNCDFFIVVLSEKSLASNWVLYESFFALMKKETGDGKVIPARIDGCLFDDEFTAKVVERKRQEIKDTEAIIGKFRKSGAEVYTHLEKKRGNLIDFMNKFSQLIDEYRNSAVLDITPNNFDHGMQKLANLCLSGIK